MEDDHVIEHGGLGIIETDKYGKAGNVANDEEGEVRSGKGKRCGGWPKRSGKKSQRQKLNRRGRRSERNKRNATP